MVAAYGALPYILAGDPQLGRPVDALFEGMSGFTTTGASVATDVSALPVSIQVWRQLTIWLGGIGVVTIALAVLPRLRVGGRQLLESELAGPGVETGLSGRIRDTARRFGMLYVGPHGGRLPGARPARLARRRRRDEHLPGLRARAQHDGHRRVLDRAAVDRRVRRR